MVGIFATMAVMSALLSWTSVAVIPVEVNLFLWAVAGFASVPALQINVMIFGKAAPNLVSTLNIAAFNVGNALGAWVGGMVIEQGLGLPAVPLAGAALAAAAMLLTLTANRFHQPGATIAPASPALA
jgi:DHA1 family inner membrane transport protein